MCVCILGDVVDFQIAKDRRDGLIHATNVTLCEESFIVSKEKRDKGTVTFYVNSVDSTLKALQYFILLCRVQRSSMFVMLLSR